MKNIVEQGMSQGKPLQKQFVSHAERVAVLQTALRTRRLKVQAVNLDGIEAVQIVNGITAKSLPSFGRDAKQSLTVAFIKRKAMVVEGGIADIPDHSVGRPVLLFCPVKMLGGERWNAYLIDATPELVGMSPYTNASLLASAIKQAFDHNELPAAQFKENAKRADGPTPALRL